MSTLLLPLLPLQALPENWEDGVVDYVTAEMGRLEAPGAAVVVVEDSQIVFARGFGVAGPDHTPVTPRTPFRVASLTKSVTALAVMQLVEAGRLDLDDTLESLLPGLVSSDSETASITVRNLLTHTSGWSESVGLVNLVDSYQGPDALERNAERIVATPLTLPTGDFEYSNANYDLLGHIVAEGSGESYSEYLRDHIFDPLEMDESFISDTEARAAGLASGHYPFFGFVRPYLSRYAPSGAPSGGALAGSAEDWGHFLIAQLDAGRYRDRTVLSAEGITTLQRPQVYPDDPCCGYAMGLWVFPLFRAGQLVHDSGHGEYRVPVVLEHTGSAPSYASGMVILPEQRLGLAVMLNVNDESVSSLYHQMHLGIAQILLGDTPPPTTASEGPIHRYGRVVALVVLAGLTLRVALSAIRLRRLRRILPGPALSATTVLRLVVVPLLIDLALIGFVWWFFAGQTGAPLTVVRIGVPDIFLTFVVASIVGVSWAMIRTGLTLRILLGGR